MACYCVSVNGARKKNIRLGCLVPGCHIIRGLEVGRLNFVARRTAAELRQRTQRRDSGYWAVLTLFLNE